jgi:UDP-3-O-[3-hydroxymyristoyl] glucosamine N-acyltransferase
MNWMPRLWTTHSKHKKSESAREWQRALQASLTQLEHVFIEGDDVFIADDAAIFGEPRRPVHIANKVVISSQVYINGPCVIHEDVSIGARSHIEGGAVGVIVGAHTRIGPSFHCYAFNHVFADPDVHIRVQVL